MVQKAQASMEVQVYLVNELKENTANTEDQIQKFKRAAEEYMIKQIVKVNAPNDIIVVHRSCAHASENTITFT